MESLKKLINKFYLILSLLIIICVNYLFSQSDYSEIPFKINEKLIYKLYYNGINTLSISLVIISHKINPVMSF